MNNKYTLTTNSQTMGSSRHSLMTELLCSDQECEAGMNPIHGVVGSRVQKACPLYDYVAIRILTNSK
jgi:hypothetical protein